MLAYPTEDPKKAGAWLYKYEANVLALDGKNPEPLPWSDWQDQRQTVDEVKQFPWHRDGVGVICGIGGWRCIDFDGIEGEGVKFGAVEKVLDALGLPHTYSWLVESGSGEGYHIWFRCEDTDFFGGCDEYHPRREGAFDHLELRWENHQTAVPPTVHPDTGMEYEFYRKIPDGPPVEVTPEKVQDAVQAVGKPKRTTSHTTAPNGAANYDAPEVETMRSALDALPDTVGESYGDWLDMIMAVHDGAPDNDTAKALLKEWRTESETGEYARKLESLDDGPPEGTEPVTVGTLFATAKEHGWSFPAGDAPASGGQTSEPSFTVADLEEALDGKEGKEAELVAYRHTDEATAMTVGELHEAKLILEQHGARAKEARDWMRDVKSEKQDADADSTDRSGPAGLKQGELTAWIAKAVQEEDDFAVGRDGALYYYHAGCYHEEGERHLHRRIKALLEAEDMVSENTTYRRNEVRELIEIGAPRLWESPPRDRLCLKNGILNLSTGELEEHAPGKWLSTRQIPIEHDPDADGEAWSNFLADVFPDDGGAELGYEVMAYLLIPPKGRRKAIHLRGGKQTGKSTFIRNFVEGVMGLDSVQHWTLQDLEENDFAAATLLGTTLNVCADLPSRSMEGTSVFKRITGGDRMTAQRKYEDPFTFAPACHLLFSGNGPIVAPGAGEAFWDRWHVIPFEQEVGPGTDAHMPRDLLDGLLQDPEELSALLNELLRVLDRVRERGIDVSESMADALAEMRGHPENDLPGHAGDGATAEQTPEKPLQTAVTGPKPADTGQMSGTDPAKNFEKEADTDTDASCPNVRASKSFSAGDRVRLPTGGLGTVSDQVGRDPPEYAVRPDDEHDMKRYTADELHPVGDDFQDEPPF